MPDPKTLAAADAATSDWISVDRHQDRDAWQAWLAFRAQHLGSTIEPQAFTVPSYQPPATPKAIASYLAAVETVRKAAGALPRPAPRPGKATAP